MFRMKDVSKVYRTEMVETHALRDLTLDVREGEFVAVTGPSGSGKTTFLNIAGLLEELTRGEYTLDGVDVKSLDDRARSHLRNEKLGFVFQSFNLIPDLDVYDNVDVPLRYRKLGRADRKKRIEKALERVGLASRVKHFPAELSGGQQQRVAIARAIARELMQLLEDLNAQGTVGLLVTHDPEIAARAQRNVHIVDGHATDLDRGASLVKVPAQAAVRA
jgi:putative ABC transport system ATP-binding protein